MTDGQDRFNITDVTAAPQHFDRVIYAAAVKRIGEIVAAGTHFFDAPLYTLRDVDLSGTALNGRFALSSFREYALTTDLVNIEIVDALATGADITWKALPLRGRFLPTIRAAADIADRGLGGGLLSSLPLPDQLTEGAASSSRSDLVRS